MQNSTILALTQNTSLRFSRRVPAGKRVYPKLACNRVRMHLGKDQKATAQRMPMIVLFTVSANAAGKVNGEKIFVVIFAEVGIEDTKEEIEDIKFSAYRRSGSKVNRL